MGFFAVLRGSADAAPFSIRECHLNLWSLGGIGRRVFKFDVGLWLEAEREFADLQIAIPFGSSQHKDLADVTRNHQISELIFSGPPPAKPVSVFSAEVDEKLSGKDYTLWNVELAQKVATKESIYVRLRFEVDDKGRVWTWKRWLFGSYGATVDIRVAEVREAVGVRNWEGLKDRIVTIDALYLFVIAPSTLQATGMSPAPTYIRLLEGKAWKPYIGRATDLFHSDKLVIYQWRNFSSEKDAKPIDPQHPYRVFLDLNRASVLGNPIVASVVAFAIVLGAALLAVNGEEIVTSAAFVWSGFSIGIAFLGLTGVLLILRFVGFIRRPVLKAFLLFENFLYGADD